MTADAPTQDIDRGVGARAVWGTGDLVLGFAGVLGFFFLLAIVVVFPVVDKYGEDSTEALFAQAITVMVWDALMVGTVYWIVRRKGGSWANLGFQPPWPEGAWTWWQPWTIFSNARGNRPWTTLRLGLAVVSAWLAALIAVDLYSVIINVLGLDDLLPGQQISDNFYNNDAVLVLLGIAVVIVAPIAEETFFRGFLFAGLRSRWRLLLAALASGFVFSLAHTDPGLIVPFTLVGMVLALTYERTGTIFGSMSVHFVFNAMSFFLLILFPELRD